LHLALLAYRLDYETKAAILGALTATANRPAQAMKLFAICGDS
jgi:hypothetical protein